jgi:hypothetical protein
MSYMLILKNKFERQWLKPITMSTQEMKIRRIRVRGQHRQNFTKPPFQLIKAEHNGVHLSYQLCSEAQKKGS